MIDQGNHDSETGAYKTNHLLVEEFQRQQRVYQQTAKACDGKCARQSCLKTVVRRNCAAQGSCLDIPQHASGLCSQRKE